MKRKWLWLLLALFLAGLVILILNSGSAGKVSVRLVAQTNDSAGQLHIVYKITNGMPYPIMLMLIDPEAYHERTGWWPVYWPTTWETGAPAGSAPLSQAILTAKSIAKIIISPDQIARGTYEGSIFRARLFQLKVESQTVMKLKSIASKLHLPRSWLMLPKPDFIQLPPAKLPKPKLVPPPSTGTPSTPSPVPAAATTNSSHVSPVSAEEIVVPRGMIRFQQAELRHVLDFYAELANAILEIDDTIRFMRTKITCENTEPLSFSAARSLLEQVLQQQAGITIQRIDNQHIKVTCRTLREE